MVNAQMTKSKNHCRCAAVVLLFVHLSIVAPRDARRQAHVAHMFTVWSVRYAVIYVIFMELARK